MFLVSSVAPPLFSPFGHCLIALLLSFSLLCGPFLNTPFLVYKASAFLGILSSSPSPPPWFHLVSLCQFSVTFGKFAHVLPSLFFFS